MEYDFYNKDTIVLTGASAGGMATIYWLNYLQEKTVTSRVLGIPDSGMYLFDYPDPVLRTSLLKMATAPLFLLGTGPGNEP